MDSQDGLKNNLVLTRFILLVSLLFSSFSVFAGSACTTPGCATKSYKGECTAGGLACQTNMRPRGVLVLSGGYAYSHVGNSQAIHLEDLRYKYHADNDVQSAPFGGASLGGEFSFPGGINLEVGLAYYEMAAYNADGLVKTKLDETVLAQSQYKYRVLAKQALVEVKILGSDGSSYHPYFTLGAGEAFNSAYDYDTKSTTTPIYDSHSTNSFSYGVGIGVDADVTSFARFGIGYRYANFGNINLGEGHLDGNETKELKMSHFHTEAWIAQLTFLV